MEFNTIIQALVKEVAEQLRPSMRALISEQLNIWAKDTDLPSLTDIQLRTIASNIHMADLAGELFDGQLAAVAVNLSKGQLETIANAVTLRDLASEIDLGGLASEIDLEDLASEINLEDLAQQIDTDELLNGFNMSEFIKEFFADNTFSIRP